MGHKVLFLFRQTLWQDMIIRSHIKGKIVFRRCCRRWAYRQLWQASLAKEQSFENKRLCCKRHDGILFIQRFCFSSDQRRRPWTFEIRKWRRERGGDGTYSYKVIRAAIKEIENKKLSEPLWSSHRIWGQPRRERIVVTFFFSLCAGWGGIFVSSPARISSSHATCLPLVQEQLEFVRYTVVVIVASPSPTQARRGENAGSGVRGNKK